MVFSYIFIVLLIFLIFLIGNTILLNDSLSEFLIHYEENPDRFKKEIFHFSYGKMFLKIYFNVEKETIENIVNLAKLFEEVSFVHKLEVCSKELKIILNLNFSLWFLNRYLDENEFEQE